MKVIRIDRAEPGEALQGVLIADSAAGSDRNPLFLPSGGRFTVEIRQAFRIGRLGKNIAPKFASRYIDALALVACLVGEDPTALAGSLTDSSVIKGPELAVDQFPASVMIEGQPIELPFSEPFAGELLASVSTNATLKTGDLIIMPQVLNRFTPIIGTDFLIPSLINLRIR